MQKKFVLFVVDKKALNRYRMDMFVKIVLLNAGNCLFTLSWKDISLNRIKNAICDNEVNQERGRKFCETKVVEKQLYIDDSNELWKLKDYGELYFSYDDIISYECIKNGTGVLSVVLGERW